MDQIEKICERLELGEPLSVICKDKDFPDVSTIYKKCRADERLKEKIMAARQTGVWTLLDKIAEDMQIPKTPQETHFLREKWSHIRWLATKLASTTFGDKSQIQQKIDNRMIITWGEPGDDIKKVKNFLDQVPSLDVKELPGNVGNNTKEEKQEQTMNK
nr:putative DNA binding protein [uncultured Mediterranean phage uvMED]